MFCESLHRKALAKISLVSQSHVIKSYVLTVNRWLHKSAGMDCGRPHSCGSSGITACHQCSHPQSLGRNHSIFANPQNHFGSRNVQGNTRTVCDWKRSPQHHRLRIRWDIARGSHRVILCSQFQTCRASRSISSIIFWKSQDWACHIMIWVNAMARHVLIRFRR